MRSDDDPGRGLPRLTVNIRGLVRCRLCHLLHRLHSKFATGIVCHSASCCRCMLWIYGAIGRLATNHISCISLEHTLWPDPWCHWGPHHVSMWLAMAHCGLLDSGSQGWSACSGATTSSKVLIISWRSQIYGAVTFHIEETWVLAVAGDGCLTSDCTLIMMRISSLNWRHLEGCGFLSFFLIDLAQGSCEYWWLGHCRGLF